MLCNSVFLNLPTLTTRICLDHKEPRTTRALSQKLGLHQSSVSHPLKDLMEEDLVKKKGKNYRLSNIGVIQKNSQEWIGRTQRCLNDYRDFILRRDLSGIPPAASRRSSSPCWPGP